MLAVPQSTALLVMFKAYDDTDHVTEATGKTIAITISKNGAAFGNPNAGATNATEVSSGWYKVSLDTTDTGTLGPLAVRGTNADIDDVGVLYQVVKATNGGWTALPDTAVTTNASLITSGTGTAQLSVTSGRALSDVDTIKTNAVVNGGTITFPTNATLASTTNITAGTITTATNVTTVNGLAAGVITATAIADGAIDAATFASGAIDATALAADAGTEIGTAVWASATRTLTAIDEDSTTLDLDATIRASVGLAAANLDTQLDALPTANENADALLDRSDAVEVGMTPRQSLRLVSSTVGAKLSGAGTTTETFRNAVADSKDRVTATVDASGNRTAIAYDLA